MAPPDFATRNHVDGEPASLAGDSPYGCDAQARRRGRIQSHISSCRTSELPGTLEAVDCFTRYSVTRLVVISRGSDNEESFPEARRCTISRQGVPDERVDMPRRAQRL